jgi:hypothetical protein
MRDFNRNSGAMLPGVTQPHNGIFRPCFAVRISLLFNKIDNTICDVNYINTLCSSHCYVFFLRYINNVQANSIFMQAHTSMILLCVDVYATARS